MNKFNNKDKRPCTPDESLEESLKEMQLIRKGILKGKSWEEFEKELKEKNN